VAWRRMTKSATALSLGVIAGSSCSVCFRAVSNWPILESFVYSGRYLPPYPPFAADLVSYYNEVLAAAKGEPK